MNLLSFALFSEPDTDFSQSGRVHPPLPLGDLIPALAVTVAVSVLLPAADALPPLVAEVITLPVGMTGMSATTSVVTVTMTVATVIVTMSAVIAMVIAGTVTVNALVIVPAALKTVTAILRRTGNAAMMIVSAARKSGKMSPTAKTGKVCNPPIGR